MFRVTRQYRFAASHRLHSPELSDEMNRAIYGKCNNPYGHGHNYVVQVTARGPVDDRSGVAVDTRRLDALVTSEVLEPFDRRNLNTEVAAFEQMVPTSENLAVEIWRRLSASWDGVFPGPWPRLEKIRIEETARNIFEIRANETE